MSDASRLCPAFGTPLADKWNTGRDVGDIITYASEAGATVSLELRSRDDSEPFEGFSRTGPSSGVNCSSSSDRQYNFENDDVALRIEQRVTQLEDSSPEDKLLFNISIEPESPAIDAVPGYAFLFSLGIQTRQQYTDSFDPNHSIDLDPRDSRFIQNLQIGNNLYPYAIEQKFVDLERLTDVTNTNSFATITRVILAEDGGNGGGLVQFELLNGEVYSRI